MNVKTSKIDRDGLIVRQTPNCKDGFLDAILDGDYKVIKILQDKRKSFVSVIRVDNQDYVFKWNRFWTRKRKKKFLGLNKKEASSFHQFDHMLYFYENDIRFLRQFS